MPWLLGWWLPVLVAPFVGSFLAMIVVRLPAGEPIFMARSRCRACGRPLSPLDLVPLLSWLVLRGRCRRCHAPIAPFYPAMEVAAVGIAAWTAALVPAPLLWPTCVLGWTLLTLAAIDIRHLILPDVLTLPLLIGGIVAAWLYAGPLVDHVLGTAAGYVVPLLLRAAYFRWRRREGLGLGDAKLIAAAGAWVSWEGLPSVLLIGAGAALVWALARAAWLGRLDARRPIPFGPYLSLGLWVVWLYGPLSFG